MASAALEDLPDRSSENQRALPDALGAVVLPHHRVMLVAVSFDRKTPRGDEPSSIRAQTSAADLEAMCRVPDRCQSGRLPRNSSHRCFNLAPALRLPTLATSGHLRACFICPHGRRTHRGPLGERTESRRARAGGAAASCTQIGVAVGVP
jgi:hypothetical protein